jgi:TusA-related sulfurtransferase
VTPEPQPPGESDPPREGGRTVDARGQRCPLPVIRLARLVRDEPHVRLVTVLATDPAAAHDIPAWCRMRGQRFVEARPQGDHTAYVVEVLSASTPEAER